MLKSIGNKIRCNIFLNLLTSVIAVEVLGNAFQYQFALGENYFCHTSPQAYSLCLILNSNANYREKV